MPQPCFLETTLAAWSRYSCRVALRSFAVWLHASNELAIFASAYCTLLRSDLVWVREGGERLLTEDFFFFFFLGGVKVMVRVKVRVKVKISPPRTRKNG